MKTKPTIGLGAALFFCLLLPLSASGFYNPTAGRWLIRDPIEESARIDLYTFVANSTANTIDLLGREGLWIVTVPIVRQGERPDNGAQTDIRSNAVNHAQDEGFTVLFVDDITDANKKIRSQNCCVKRLSIQGHGAGFGQWVGSSTATQQEGRYINLKKDEKSGKYIEHGFEMFDKVKFCGGCLIEMGGCTISNTEGGREFIQRVANKTGCRVKAFAANAYCGPDGITRPAGDWFDRFSVTDTAYPTIPHPTPTYPGSFLYGSD